MSKNDIQTDAQILVVLALKKEMSQYDLPNQIGKHYTTVLRQLRKMDNQGLVKVVRTARSKKKGKDKKIYSLTFSGVINAFFLFTNKDEWETDRILKLIENYPNALVTFKKWSLFKQAGLEGLMLLYVYIGIKNFLITLNVESKYNLQPEKPYDERGMIDGNILYLALWASKPEKEDQFFKANPQLRELNHSKIVVWGKKLAKIFKNDPELREIINKVFTYQLEENKKIMACKEWYDAI